MKLTLRDLFWLVLVCALVAGWLAERQRLHGELAVEKDRNARLADMMPWKNQEL